MNETPARAALAPLLSDKFRFWSFVSMALLVFVHGYTIPPTYLQPWTTPELPLGVTSFVEYLLANGLLRFRIPMLFAISGYLFALHDAQPHRQRMQQRVRTLLVPYFLWSGLHLAIFYWMEMDPTTRSWVAATDIAAVSEQQLLVHDYHWHDVLIRWLLAPLPYQLWFIRVLLVYNLAYPWLARWVTGRRSAKVFFGVAALLWLLSFNVFFFEGEGLLFFGLGIWMQKSGFDLAMRWRWLRPAPWAVVWWVSATAKTWLAFKGQALMGDAVFVVMANLHKLCIFSGLVAAWYGSDGLVRYLMAKRWFVWCSAFSFMIYALHAPLVAVLIGPCLRLFGNLSDPHLATYLALPLSLIAVSVLLGATLRRMTPDVYALLTGGRGLSAGHRNPPRSA